MAVNQLKAGAALSYVIIAINVLVGVLYTPFMLRTLGQAEFGLYSLAASIIAYLTILDLGFGNAIIRYTAKFRAEGQEREQYEMFGMFLRLYIGIGFIALLIGLALMLNVEWLFGGTMSGGELEKMKIILMLISFNLAFTFPLSIFSSIISAYENFVFQKVISIIRALLNPLVMIVLLILGYKAIAMVVVTTLFNLATLVINWWYCRNRLKIKIMYGKFKWGFFKEVSTYSLWILLSVVMDRIYWSSGQFILGVYKGTLSVAVYSVAIQLIQLFMLFSTAISGVFLPKVTAIATVPNSEKALSDLFIKTGRIQYIVMAYILSGFILLGRPFVLLWAGADYAQSYYIALIFFIPLMVPLIQNLGITILQARNQMKFRSILYVVIALLSLLLSILLAPRYGALGCAASTALALIAGQIVAMNIYYKRHVSIDITHFWREIGKMSVLPALLLLVASYILKGFEVTTLGDFTLAAALFSAVYIPLFWFFSMNSYERGLIREIARKIKLRLVG